MDSKPNITYVERAVQTEPPRQLSRSENLKAPNLHHPLELNDAAYNQTSSLTISKRGYKLPQLAYKRPSELNNAKNRIVSLPETSPPSRIKSDSIRDRVVSMSHQAETSVASNEADNSLSSEWFENSIETSQSQNSSDVGNYASKNSHPRRSLVFSHTPSPPSSPESVMIIGNNVQVPSSFLSQKVVKVVDREDDGWMTWSSSPPKPIPALHGPLSLPYARCPSGAEGTIIEGDNITRTIWGLGNDNGLNRENGTASNHTDQPGKPDTLRQIEPPITTPLEPRNVGGNHLDDIPCIYPNIPGARDPHRTQQLPDSFERPIKERNPFQGLGLICNEEVKHNPYLKASAPEFVPSGLFSQQPRPRISLDPARSQSTIPKHQMAAIDLAYRAQQENKTPLLETPNTTSTTWSPYLPTPLPPHSDGLADVWNSEDAADEIRRFIFERIGQQNLSPFELKQVSELIRSMNLDRTFAYPSSSYDVPFSAPNFSPVNTALDLDPHHFGAQPQPPLSPLCSSRSGAVSMTPLSPNFSHAGGKAHGQPRSVPFARLLQRRLSAVLDEPSPTSELVPIALRPGRSTFGGSADAYKPYFAHTASQKAPHLPDISNHANVGTMHRTSSSDSEPFKAGNLEVGEYVPRVNSVFHPRATKAQFNSGNRGRRSNVLVPGTSVNKENNLTARRSVSADSNKSVKSFARVAAKEGGRKKSKGKARETRA